MHDLLYVYGFNEASGNFQTKNFNRGGYQGDNVRITTYKRLIRQSIKNKAKMGTPPDGQRGELYLGVWENVHAESRDSAFDNSVIIHEYTHGLSSRLTGGANRSGCLKTWEAGALSEGWSDAVAFMLSTHKGETRMKKSFMGTYVTADTFGVRPYPYTSSNAQNPLTYSDIAHLKKNIHSAGQVWATILWEVYWNLIEHSGFEQNWYKYKSPKGNIVMLNIIIYGMKLQPCNPTALQARDAIFWADTLLYQGAHSCILWRGFALRGLGFDAFITNGFTIPTACL